VGTLDGASAVAQTTLDDRQILAVFDEVNTANIWAARLALSRAHSPEVRELAQMVIADHKAVQQMARDLARKLHIVAIPPSGDANAAALAQTVAMLQSSSGADFDRAYVEHELQFHRSAIDAVKQTLLPAARSAELKGLLTKVLPGFTHHLAETQKAAGVLGVR
jgi:putative membrane protein